jgi:hypothetical protein
VRDKRASGIAQKMNAAPAKTTWAGKVLAAQPRIRLTRSFDQRSHVHLGYVLRIGGTVNEQAREFTVAVGHGAHDKHLFRIGDQVSGQAVPVADHHLETADYYKVTGLKVLSRGAQVAMSPPPFLGVPPPLTVYRERGHRRLAARTYAAKCATCIWGCEMAVELVIDQWNPSVRRYRRETFCYGPKSCPFYAAGSTRKVPGRKGMIWEEEDWVDEEAVSHRGPDD